MSSPQQQLNNNGYQTSDSTDSPVTSPTTMPGSPADQLINGGSIASPQQSIPTGKNQTGKRLFCSLLTNLICT